MLFWYNNRHNSREYPFFKQKQLFYEEMTKEMKPLSSLMIQISFFWMVQVSFSTTNTICFYTNDAMCQRVSLWTSYMIHDNRKRWLTVCQACNPSKSCDGNTWYFTVHGGWSVADPTCHWPATVQGKRDDQSGQMTALKSKPVTKPIFL